MAIMASASYAVEKGAASEQQPSGVKLNPNGESKILWVFDTPESEWIVTGGPGSFVPGFQYGHCGDDYYANDLARKDHNQYGKPVYAGIDGIVYAKDIKDKSGNYIAWGKEVIIYNPDSKFALRYAHLSEYDASLNGNWISATSSKPIGKVGDTGLGSGAHLHLVLYKNVNSIEEGYPVSVSSCSVQNEACVKSATEHAAQFSFIPRSVEKRVPKVGDQVYIATKSSIPTYMQFQGEITDIEDGLICLKAIENGKSSYDMCIGTDSIASITWI
jgi:hypothetical protein